MTAWREFACGLFAACLMAADAASAQTYPNRPITMIVPYPPGGATDTIARIMQDSMSQSLGQRAARPAPRRTATPFCCIKSRWRPA